MGKLLDWLDHRTGYRKLRDALLLEHIPGGARWRYVWGSTLAFVFTLQVVTGILLMTAYVPGDGDAWGSVHYIQYQMDFGWLIRGLHHFGSQMMVVLMGLHMLQVVIAGAHLPPREVNWWLGLALMGIVLGMGLTGYLLPWDQKGYYATKVATNILSGIPVIGPFLQKALVGGDEYGHPTLTHFFALHVAILPPLLVLLLILHVAVFRRHGVTAPATPPEDATPSDFSPAYKGGCLVRDVAIGAIVGGAAWYFHVPAVTAALIFGLFLMFGVSRFFIVPKHSGMFWPDQAFRDLLVSLWIFAIMLSLVMFGEHGHKINPGASAADVGLYDSWAKAGRDGMGANLDAPADPLTQGYPARPEWYFLFLFQLLKYFEGEQELIGTVVIPGAVTLLLFLVPLFGHGRMRKFGHAFGIFVVVVLLAFVAMLTVQAVAQDSAESWPFGLGGSQQGKDHQKRLKEAEAEAKIAVQAAMDGLPADGSRQVVRANPLIKGKERFKTHCATCHAFDFGEPPDPTKKDEKLPEPTASDLTHFSNTYEWVRGLLRNPADKKYFGRTPNLRFMIDEWRAGIDEIREGYDEAQKKEQDRQLDEIAWWVAQQAIEPEQRNRLLKKDEDFSKRWVAGLQQYKAYGCQVCHNTDTVPGPNKGPDLTGYGSNDWVHRMVLSPTHSSRYDALWNKKKMAWEVRNTMPAFRPPADTVAGKLARDEFLESLKLRDEEGKEITDAKGKPLLELPQKDIIDLSDYDRELIVRFLMRDDRVVFGGQPIAGPPRKKD